MSKFGKWITTLIAILLLAVLGYVLAGPYLAINGIRNLIASGQYDQLWRFVDFEQLRENMRPQLQQRVAHGILEHTGSAQAAQVVGKVTALITQPAVDLMASPEGIATLLKGSALLHRLNGEVDAEGKAHAIDPLKNAETEFESPSLFIATTLSAEGQPVMFEFRRNGLSWKLTGIRLPEE